MVDKLSCLRTGNTDTHSVDYVVKPSFQKGEHIFTGDALHSVGTFIVISELTFLNAVNTLNLLLFSKLLTVFGNLLPACAVCAGSYGTLFERTLAVITFVAL